MTREVPIFESWYIISSYGEVCIGDTVEFITISSTPAIATIPGVVTISKD